MKAEVHTNRKSKDSEVSIHEATDRVAGGQQGVCTHPNIEVDSPLWYYQPPAPQNLVVVSSSFETVELGWDDGTGVFDTYTVYVQNVETGNIEQTIRGLSLSEAEVMGLDDTEYEFWVVTKAGNVESIDSNHVTAHPALSAPQNFSVEVIEGSVLLQEDWSGYALDRFDGNLDENWTQDWVSADHYFELRDGSSTARPSPNYGSKYVIDAVLDGFPNNHMMSSDEVGSNEDYEILNLIRRDSDTGNGNRLYARISGSGEGNETAYFAEISNGGSDITIKKFINGSITLLKSTSKSFSTETWYWMRFSCIGSALKAKFWQHGLEEPSGWDVEATDSDISSGKAGVGYRSSNGVVTVSDYIGISGGIEIPLPE